MGNSFPAPWQRKVRGGQGLVFSKHLHQVFLGRSTAIGAAPGASWTTWTADVVIGRPCRIHAYSAKGGMIDSQVIRRDFPYTAR